ncbi:hypothetical protein [Paraburkholderia haematera]|uniref:hypothetical protein n=1 Tax=Paraburkholderia haematera TaxID=2793077 RepID=UPI001F387FDD|nr:hypothetical protein [Paraburkholderia haematera]
MAVAGTACNKQPVQPQSVQAIGRDMIVNGVATSIVGIQYAGTPDDVSKAFREFWTAENVPAKSQNNPSGLLLSALDGPCLYTLTIAPQPDGSRTRGLMSVIRVGNEQVTHRIPDAAIPLPEGGKVVSDIESRDPGQTGRTWMINLQGDARWNALQYRNRLAAQRWSSVGRQPDYQSSGARSVAGTAFVMQRDADSVDASFSDRDGKTVAVINAIRSR